VFEVRYSDLAGRIGRLKTPHGIVETPAFVPVVHPVRQAVGTKVLKEIGFDLVITNAYITLRHYGEEARRRGIHDIINFDGSVMTDSGGYQVLEYGSVDTAPEEIARFQLDIKSDIAIPLDKPTGYGLDRQTAKEYVDVTLKNARETLSAVGQNTDAIWVGPVQGAEHSDLVEHSARELDKMGFQLMALGSPVELMEAYEFAALAHMIAAAKRVVPSKPVHLFGAGHPLTIPLAVALGCDMFDSASYILYAKDGRYITPNATVRIDELTYLPCRCPVCSSHTLRDLRGLKNDERTVAVAKHNLHVLKAEVDAVKQAIVDGRLWEYVMQKARAHPKLMEAARLFSDFEFLESGTRLFKSKAIYFYEPIDQHRPESRRYRRMVSEFRSPRKQLVICPETSVHPLYSTTIFREMVRRYPDAQVCSYNPFLGIIPAEISDVFPASHNVVARSQHRLEDYPSFVESLVRFVARNSFEEIIVPVHDEFIENAIKAADLDKRVVRRDDAIPKL
jgi:7-cyano-7-deazaguanine tRNA-ribosyltransferase